MKKGIFVLLMGLFVFVASVTAWAGASVDGTTYQKALKWHTYFKSASLPDYLSETARKSPGEASQAPSKTVKGESNMTSRGSQSTFQIWGGGKDSLKGAD